jgi:lipoate-protein ligase A
MDDVVGKVQDIVEDDLKEIGKAVESVQKSLGGEGELADAVANVTKAVTKVPQDVRKAVEDDMTNVNESVEDALDSMVKGVQDAVEDDLKKIDQSITDIRAVASGKEEDDADSKKNTGDVEE